jgi:hypothetical protein
MMFLTIPSHGTTPQTLKQEFPAKTWGPKTNVSKIN